MEDKTKYPDVKPEPAKEPVKPEPVVHIDPAKGEAPRFDSDVDVLMTAEDGGHVNRWLIGPAPGIPLTEAYDFRPCCPTTVNAKDAKALIAGGAWTGGRKFIRADSADGRAALAASPLRSGW